MKRRSIQRRLVVMSFAASAAAILASSVGILAHHFHNEREELLVHLESTASVVGANCSAALAFHDSVAAWEALESASHIPDMEVAALFGRDGAVFVEYEVPGVPRPKWPREAPRPGRRFSIHAAEVVVPVELDRETIGFVYLRAGTTDVIRESVRYAAVAAIAAIFSLVVALGLLTRLIARATRPVLELSALTEVVATGQDYTVRAEVRGDDELAALAAGFNQMLATIQQRDAALEAHGRTLEAEVAARTAELAASNERLQAELSRQQLLREQLTQAQKMEAVGRLAGGVAHDFNNALSVIMTYAGSLGEELPEGEQREAALEIQRAGNRATALTRQLLAFSRKQVLRPEPLDVREVVGNLTRMIGRLIGEHIELVVRVDGSSGAVYMDASQLEQVLVNLAVNARDAMPSGGLLAIETRDVDATAGDAIALRLAPGPYVRIRVSDTGTGMDAATLDRIFEPFFTTKPKGQGTGLGLAMVYGAIQQSGGSIEVASRPGEGTTFTIHLPRLAAALRARNAERRRAPTGNGERILVVEDEPQLRATVRRFLRSEGYAVAEAANGEEGLAAYRAHPPSVDLILTDVVMPSMGGFALGRAIRESSGVPILYMSGYSEEVASGKERIAPEEFIPKPFDHTTLLDRVHAALRGAERAARRAAG